jgi:hypothetical protein
MNGVAVKPLTVDFHEGGFLDKLNQENQFGFWFQLNAGEKEQAGSPWGPSNPQALNRYSYTQNNPVRWADPSGHNPCLPLVAGGPVGVGAAIGCTAIVVGIVIVGSLTSVALVNAIEDGVLPNPSLPIGDTGGNTSPNPLDPTPGPNQGGVQTTSTTLYNRNGVRVDVENPNPGQRSGQVHIHVGKGKYIYDVSRGEFANAPKSVQRLLNNPDIQRAVQRGVQEFLGIK